MTATADSGAPGALFAAYLGEKRPQIEAFLAACAPACVPGTAEATRADLNRYLYQPLARFTASYRPAPDAVLVPRLAEIAVSVARAYARRHGFA